MNASEIVREQAKALRERRNHAVVTIVHSDGSTPRSSGKMLVFEDGSSMGTIGGGAVELMAVRDACQCIREGSGGLKAYDLTSPDSNTGMVCGGRISVLIETFVNPPLLVMCGAGHVGGAVLKLAKFVGFDTLLLDDREESDVADKIALADRFIRMADFAADLRALDLAPGAFIVIATHGHAFDGAALTGALEKRAAYVGMIGSRKKIAALFERLRAEGISQEALDGVYTPIGLDLGGETPEEIAVSILSEILMVKNGRTGVHLKK